MTDSPYRRYFLKRNGVAFPEHGDVSKTHGEWSVLIAETSADFFDLLDAGD